jgi:predicted MPP superfamily phosphohydrolase
VVFLKQQNRLMMRKLTRRQALTSMAVGLGSLVGLYTWRVEPHWLEFTYPVLPISGLPRELDGRTLAQISDLHVGPKVDDDYIIKSLRSVQELDPDFVVFTGDWITYRNARQFEQLRRIMAHMPHGRLGTVSILGNHDYGYNWRMVDVAEEVVAIVRSSGVTVLRNDACTIAGLQFIGLDDLWSPRFDPGELLVRKEHDESTVVLCHNPDAADHRVWGQYQGWILAGHTHGGQCKPPFLPPPLLPVKNKRYTAGEIELSGNRRLYISRGVGHLLRVRFNVRPEIPIFRLQRAS